MTQEDARRWNQRYLEDQRFQKAVHPKSFLVAHADLLPVQGIALDVAMGLGGNAAYLIDRGLRVVGVDISDVALRQAKGRLPQLMAVRADLTNFSLPESCFDLILNFYYLQRSLWSAYRRWLRPGGLLIIETLLQEMRACQPDIDPAFLLEPGELKEAFSDLELLVYREGWENSAQGHPRAVAGLIARL
jgi:SAM-dependent methyltransferase